MADTLTDTLAALELRRGAPGDHAALVAMYLSFEPKGAAMGLPPRKEPEHWLEGLAAFPGFVVTAGDRAVGHGVLCPEGDTAEVAVFVHQDYRGRRLGRRLLTALIEEAGRLNLRKIWGTAEFDNLAMLRLARSLGFMPGKDPREFYLGLRPSTEEISAT